MDMLNRRKRRRSSTGRLSLLNFFKPRSRRKARSVHAAVAPIESLEARLLMTTLVSGEVFEYIQADPLNPQQEGATVRVATNGNIVVELIAVDYDDQNNPLFGDVPGIILNSDIGRTLSEVLGGRGGRDGVDLVGPTPIFDPVTDPTIFLGLPDITEEINFNAIAANDLGQTYGLNVAEHTFNPMGDPEDTRTLVQVAELDNQTGQATVVATINNATFDDVTTATLLEELTNIQAVGIDPNTGRMYVVNEETPFSGSSVSFLYEVNRTSGDVERIGFLNLDPASSFQETAAGTFSDQLFGYSSSDAGLYFSIFDNNLLNNAVFVSPSPNPANALNHIPRAHVNGDLGDNFDIRALALTQNNPAEAEEDRGFAVVARNNALELFEILRGEEGTSDTTGFNSLGRLVAVVGGNTVNLSGINAMDIRVLAGEGDDNQVLLYFTARAGTGDNLGLYVVDVGDQSGNQQAAGTVVATLLDSDNNGLGNGMAPSMFDYSGRQFSVNGLAFTPDQSQLLAVIRNTNTNVDQLVRIDITDTGTPEMPMVSGTVVEVRNANMGTFVRGMDMYQDTTGGGMGVTRLMAFDEGADGQIGGGDRRVIEINTADGMVVSELAGGATGTLVSEELFGFDMNSIGQIFSIWDDSRGLFNNSLMASSSPGLGADNTLNNPNSVHFNPVFFANGDLEGDFNVVDTAVSAGAGTLHMLDRIDDGGTVGDPTDDQFRLLVVARDGTNDFAGFPGITNPTIEFGGSPITDIRSIELLPNDLFAFAGTPLGGDGNQVLYQMDQFGNIVEADLLNDGRQVTDSIKAVAFNRATGLLMGVRDVTNGPASGQGDQLIAMLTETDDEVNTYNLGRIEITSGGTTFTDNVLLMDYNVNNELIGTYDFNGAAANGTGLINIIGSPLSGVEAMGFNAAGDLYIGTQDFDGNTSSDFTGLTSIQPDETGNDPNQVASTTSTTDVALVNLGRLSLNQIDGRFSLSDVSVVREFVPESGFLEVIDLFTSMEFLNETTNLGAFAGMSGQVFATTLAGQLLRIATPPGAPSGLGFNIVNIESRSDIANQDVDEDNPRAGVDAIAFSRDAFNNLVLAGIDRINQEDEDAPNQPIMLSLNPADAGESTIIGFPGIVVETITPVGGLSSFDVLGNNRPLLIGIEHSVDFFGNPDFQVGPDGQQIIIGSVASVTLGDDGAPTLTSVQGADFHPIIEGNAFSNLLFFVADSGEGDELWSIDVSLGNPTLIQNTLTHRGSFFTPDDVGGGALSGATTIAFDQVTNDGPLIGGPDTAILYGVFDGNILRQIPIAGPGGGTGPFRVGGQPGAPGNIVDVSNITGMDFIDDPNQPEPFFFAVDNAGENSRLVRVRIGPNTTYSLGPLDDPDDPAYRNFDAPGNAPARGEDIQGFTYNPVLVSAQTGEPGAFLGTDVTRDVLLQIDTRPRFPNADMFAMYVTQSDLESSISVAVVSAFEVIPLRGDMDGQERLSDDPAPRSQYNGFFMQPFTGPDVQPVTLQVVNTMPPTATIFVTQPGASGGVYLGGRSEDINPNTNLEQLLPLIETFLAQRLGTRPVLQDDLPNDPNNDLSSGIVITESLLEFYQSSGFLDGMMGDNLDNIGGLAISRDGQNIVVVDTDTLNHNLQPVFGNQLSFLNPGTGTAIGTPIELNDGLFAPLGNFPLTGIQGLDFGDVDFNASTGQFTDTGEDLYAVFTTADPIPVDRFDEVSGEGLGGPLDPAPGVQVNFDALGDVVDLAVTPIREVFALVVQDGGNSDPTDDLFQLHQIFRDDSNAAVTDTVLLGNVIDPFGNRIISLHSLEGRIGPEGGLLTAGQNLELPLPTDSVGGTLGVMNLTALTATDSGDVFAVDTASNLYLVTRNPDGSVDTTMLIGPLDSGGTIENINDIDYDPITGQIFFLGTVGGAPELHLYSSTTSGAVTDRGIVMSGGNPVTGTGKGVAFHPTTGQLWVVVDNGFDDELMRFNDLSDTIVDFRQSINVGLRRTLVRGMDFTTTGQLKAFDFFTDQNRLITINLANPLNSSNASPNDTIPVGSAGFTVDPITGRGLSANGDQLLTNPNQIYQIVPTVTGATASPVADLVTQGPDRRAVIMDVVALAQDPNPNLDVAPIVVVTDSNGTLAGGQQLFDVNIFTFDNGTPFDTFDDRRLGELTPTTVVPGTTDILVDTDADGIGDTPANVGDMDFIYNIGAGLSQLFATNNVGTAQAQVLALNLADPSSSFQVSAPGTVHPDLRGYASDPEGLFYGINTFETQVPGKEDELWVSRINVPTLGLLDVNTGILTRIGALPGVDGIKAFAFSPFEGSTPGQQGLYVIDDRNRMLEVNFIQTPDGAIGQLVTNNEFTVLGLVVDAATLDDTFDFGSMDFDNLGNLYAHDLASGNFVDIAWREPDRIPAGASSFIVAGGNTLTSVGSLRPTVGAISYDAANDQFLAVDNASGMMFTRGEELGTGDPTGPTGIGQNPNSDDSATLMRLRGFASDSPTGQNISELLFGGTVTGMVRTAGSMDTFYDGWHITGETGGMPAPGAAAPTRPDNFFVAGDLRDWFTAATVGTVDGQNYFVGTDLEVVGRLGQVFTLGSYVGFVNVRNEFTPDGLTIETLAQLEKEVQQGAAAIDPGAVFEGRPANHRGGSAGGMAIVRADFDNDTFETAQRLGTVSRNIPGAPPLIQVNGAIDNTQPTLPARNGTDNVDYYAVSLMAGQTITLQLLSNGPLNMGLFDPDGRLVASDHDGSQPNEFGNQAFRFTADKPGEWRVAVSYQANGEFAAAGPTNPLTEYTVFIEDAGDIALGALRTNGSHSAGGNGLVAGGTPAVAVRQGDLGALRIGGAENISAAGILVENGNLRVVDAGSIGARAANQAPTNPFAARVPVGDIGLLRARGTMHNVGDVVIGGSLQFVDSPNNPLIFSLMAGGGIGVIRALHFGFVPETSPPSLFEGDILLDTDRTGNDGIIDLIDVSGDLVAPSIDTGLGGNVRYVRVGGLLTNASPFGSDAQTLNLSPGTSFNFSDDSGGRFTLVPTSDGTLTVDPITGLLIPVEHSLTVRTLSVAGQSSGIGIGGGGLVLVDVTSTGSLTVRGNSLTSGNNSLEIGTIFANGAGRGLVRDPLTGELVLDPTSTNNLNVFIEPTPANNATDQVGVFDIRGGNFSTIHNRAGGEIVNVTATSIGELRSRGTLGLTGTSPTNFSRPNTANNRFFVHDPLVGFDGGEMRGITVLSNDFPYSGQTTLIRAGTVAEIHARHGLGNILITGDVGLIHANTDDTDVPGLFEGINAPVVTGNLGRINIGEGVLPSGTGRLAHAGIFSTGTIGVVTNARPNANATPSSDIRGDIGSVGPIELIELFNGSIIHADIDLGTEFENTWELPIAVVGTVDEAPDTLDQPIFDIGAININRGGIIGSTFQAPDIGLVRITNGFGVISSVFSVGLANDGEVESNGNAVFAGIITDGLGIRFSTLGGGQRVGQLIARGDGQVLSITDFPASVRFSESAAFNPFTGQIPTLTSDLHAYMVFTDVFNPALEGITNSGVFEDNVVAGALDLDRIEAFRIQTAGRFPTTFNLRASALPGSDIVFGNSIGEIRTIDTVDSLRVTTGRLDRFLPGSHVTNTQIGVAGQVKSVLINGDFSNDSRFFLSGPSGLLGSFTVAGDMDGDIFIAGTAGTISIGGDLFGTITIDPTNAREDALRLLQVGGSVFQGALDIDGNVGTIDIAGSLGQETNPDLLNFVFINGDLGALLVGTSGNANLDGATLAADVLVDGNLGRLEVNGKVTGDVIVRGDLSSARIAADNRTGRNAPLTPARDIGDLFDGTTTDFDFSALALRDIEHAGDFFAVQAVPAMGGGIVHELMSVSRQVNGDLVGGASLASIGTILSGATPVLDITTLEYDPFSNALDDRLLTIGTLMGGTGTFNLFGVDETTGAATNLGMLFNAAHPIGYDRNRFSIGGLAYDNRGTIATGDDRLFAIIHDSLSLPFPSDMLVTIQIGTGFVSELGVVKANATFDTNIKALEVVGSGTGRQLVALQDNPNIPNDSFLLAMNPASPANAFLVDAAGSATEDLIGLASDGQKLYAINDGSVRADDGTPINQIWQSDLSVVFGRVAVGGTLGRFEAVGGDLDADVNVGGNIGSLAILNGDLSPTRTVSSALGGIGSFAVTGGDVHGRVLAVHGEIGTFTVSGSDVSGQVLAESLGRFQIDGSLLDGAEVRVTRELSQLAIGTDIQSGASVAAGSASKLTVSRDLNGSMDIGAGERSTSLSVGNNLTGQVRLQGDASVSIARNVGRDNANQPVGDAYIRIGGDGSATVGGVFDGQLVIDGFGNLVSLGSASNAVIVTGFDLVRFTASGPIANSLIQAGLSAGNDGLLGTGDPGERSRMGQIGSFSAATLGNSIVAAGGAIGTVTVNGMTDSSISSGFSVGNTAAGDVAGDPTPLANLSELDAARAGGNRALFHGNVGRAALGTLFNGVLSAGVDPNGAFGDANDSVISASVTGGRSTVQQVSANGFGLVTVDSGDINAIRSNLGGGVAVARVDYGDEDVAPGFGSEGLIGFADQNSAVRFTAANGSVVTISVRGNGRVEVRDELGLLPGGGSTDTDNIIDTLLVRNGDSSTQVTIRSTTAQGNPVSPNLVVNVGRIVTADDTTVGSILFDGDIVGKGPFDLWLDGPVNSLTFRDMPNDSSWVGRIGGDLGALAMDTQGPGVFYVGGAIKSASITDATGVSLLGTISPIAPGSGLSDSVTLLATDAMGNDFVFDAALGLVPVDIETGVAIGAALPVTESFDQRLLNLSATEFLSGELLGISEMVSTLPTNLAGLLSSFGVSIGALAVNTFFDVDGSLVEEVVGVENAGFYGLGGLTSDFNNVVGITVNNSGVAFFIDRDVTGNFDLYRLNTLADGSVNTANPFVLVADNMNSGGTPVRNIGALETNPATNELTFIGNLNGSPAQRLFTVNGLTGGVTAGATLSDGATVTDLFTGLAYQPGVNTLFAVRQAGGSSDTLVTVTPAGVVTTRGQIGINGNTANVNVRGMDFHVDGSQVRLVAYSDPAGADNAQRLLINRNVPLQSNEYSRAGSDPDNAADLASLGERFVTIVNASGSSDLLQGFREIPDRIVGINALTGQVAPVGNIVDITGNFHFNSVMEIAFRQLADGTPLLYGMIDDADGAGSAFNRTDGAVQALLNFSSAGGVTTIRAVNTDPDFPLQRPTFLDTDLGAGFTPMTDEITAMAFDRSDRLYTIRRAGGQDFLQVSSIRQNDLDTATRDLNHDYSPVGPGTGLVQVLGANTNIVGLGLNENHDFVAYNINPSAGAEIIGLDVAERLEVVPNADDNTFATATDSQLLGGRIMVALGAIDTPVGISGVRDKDVYSLVASAGDVITLEAHGEGSGFSDLDPVVSIYDAAGNLLATDDDGGQGFDSRLSFAVPLNGTYFVVIQGFGGAGPTNPYAQEPTGGSQGEYRLEIGLNAGQINPAAFEYVTTPGILNGGVDEYAIGQTSEFFNAFALDNDTFVGGDFFNSPSFLQPLAQSGVPVNVIGGDLGGSFNIVDITVAPTLEGNRTFAINFNDQGTAGTGDDVFELYEIFRDPVSGRVTGFAKIGDVFDPTLPGPSRVTDVFALASNSLGELFIVGRSGPSSGMKLYQLSSLGEQVVPGGALEARATPRGLLAGGSFTSPITGLAFDSTNTLFAVQQFAAGRQNLLTLDSSTGAISSVRGEILVAGLPSNVLDIAFGANDALLGTEAAAGAAEPQRIIEIVTGNPALSNAVTARGEVNENLRGYAFDQTRGDFVAIYSDAIVNDQLWSSPDVQRSSVLGVMDPLTGGFQQRLPLAQDVFGTPLSASVAAASADNVTSQTLFVFTADGRLFEYDPTGAFIRQYTFTDALTGTAASPTVVDGDSGAALNITSAAFNDAGVFNGVDAAFNQLVLIELDRVNGTAVVTSASEPGSVVARQIADISFDSASSRLLALTDDPATFSRFGTETGDLVGGLTANSIDKLAINPALSSDPNATYSGRVVTVGNTIKSVTVNGDFTGIISSDTDILSYSQRAGDFNGVLRAERNIGKVDILAGDFGTGGVVDAGESLGSLTMKGRNSVMAGSVTAGDAGKISIAGNVGDSGQFNIGGTTQSFSVGGAFEGDAAFADILKLDIKGTFASTASVVTSGDLGGAKLGGGTALGSLLHVGGSAKSVAITGTHRGVVGTRFDLGSGKFGEINGGLVSVGTNSKSLSTGSVVNSVLSVGTWVGLDGVYNTADDVIYGGSVDKVSIGGNFTSSVVSAGVLPSRFSVTLPGTPNLPQDNRDYIGMQTTLNGAVTRVDSAEAGGIYRSTVGSFSVKGQVIGTGAERGAFLVAADGIGKVTGRSLASLQTRVYGDPLGAPTIERISVVNNSRFDIFLSEEINTDSLGISQDVNNDGDLLDPEDFLDSITLRDQDGNVLDDPNIFVTYRVVTDENGNRKGVIGVNRVGGFGARIVSASFNGSTGDVAIADRSGGRSGLRDFDQDGVPGGLEAAFFGTVPTRFGEDPFGTILDGNGSGGEGGTADFVSFFADAADTFLGTATQPAVPLEMVAGYAQVRVGNNFNLATDVDVYRFTANAYEYFSVNYSGSAAAQLAVFVRDDQGTPNDPSDDTFELITRHNANLQNDIPLRVVPAANDFYLELPPMEAARGFLNDLFGAGGDAEIIPLMQRESDGTLASANATGLVPGARVTTVGTIGDDTANPFQNDYDVFSFEMQAGHFMSASLDRFGPPTLNGTLVIYDSTGSGVTFGDMDNPVSFTAPVSGTYYAVVNGRTDIANPDFIFDPVTSLPQTSGGYRLTLGMGDEADGLQTEGLSFFVAVLPDLFEPVFNAAGDNTYTLTMTRAATDDLLDGLPNNQLSLPEGQQVAYISNFLNANNNKLGFNAPKQLVYVNFAGGVSDKTDPNGDGRPDTINFSAFDSAVLDPSLTGLTNVLIQGGVVQGQTINGIVDNMIAVYRTTAPSNPLGQLNVQRIGGNLTAYHNASSGLFFTTVKPNLPDDQYSTLFIGQSDLRSNGGFLGLAQHIDLANLDKGDQAIIVTEEFAGFVSAASLADRVQQYANAIANTAAHELAHILGLNHTDSPLIPDDPDNNPFTFDDSNRGPGLISSGATQTVVDRTLFLRLPGTAPIFSAEFPLGDIDMADSLLKWLGGVV